MPTMKSLYSQYLTIYDYNKNLSSLFNSQSDNGSDSNFY